MGRHTPAYAMNITALLAGLFSGIIASMGMGGGAVLLIYLTVFAGISQMTAQGINLIFFIPIAILALIIYTKKKLIDFKAVLPIIITGLLGALPGLMLAKYIGSDALSKIFAVFIILIGLREIFGKYKKKP